MLIYIPLHRRTPHIQPSFLKFTLVAYLGLCFSACAVKQISVPTSLVQPTVPSQFKLLESVTLMATNVRSLILKPNTHWLEKGKIDQGDVFGTRDQVVIVNSFNVREAHIVINDGYVVGYYLPVEKSFVPVTPVKVMFEKMEISDEV